MDFKTKLQIPYDVIEDHISCTICLSVMRGAVLTPCGHRFCSRCITEWVGRTHTCPCCNSHLETSKFYCDVQFDNFVEAILIERDKAEQECFDKMFNTATSNQDEPDKEGVQQSMFEQILKDHLKSSLQSHQRYFDKLREDCQRKINLLDSGIGDELLLAEGTGANKETLKARLKQNLEESEKLASEAYNRYLADHLPSLDLLPVDVSVYLADKDFRIANVRIHPLDKLLIIKPSIEAAMQERCDEITQWEEENGVKLLFSPLSKQSTYDVTKVMQTLDSNKDVHQLHWDSQPFFQCHMRPGSEIVLKNAFRSQSDLPKRCFAKVFKEVGAHPVDYFFCENCNFKWICKSCIQCCHSGHKISVFVMKHIPTWACCYCPKKKTCKIQDR